MHSFVRSHQTLETRRWRWSEILAVANDNGIRRYRFNNANGTAVTGTSGTLTVASFADNTFGDTMSALLDGVRANHDRLAALNARDGNLCGVAHTHGGNIGTSVYDYEYAMRDIDPKSSFQIGFDFQRGVFPEAAAGW